MEGEKRGDQHCKLSQVCHTEKNDLPCRMSVL